MTDVRETIETHKKDETTGSPGYNRIMVSSMRSKFARLRPLEFDFTGTLKSWSYLDQIHTIATPLTNGVMDEEQDVRVSHFFQRILHVR
ncbi:hypothetical protein BDR06DRAFT_567378 [Suillus hirtellus]|nr:hypothetical protein BDR06DRAFT_567378 [Suillus hirtellus]